MKPVSPVINKQLKILEVVYAEYQPEYLNLPVLKYSNGLCISRWKLSWKERLRVLFAGNIYLSILTFNKPLQPVKLSTISRETGY